MPSPLQILLVDDDLFVRRSLTRVLSPHQITEALDGSDAIRLLDAGARFDVIVTDLLLPTVSGLEVVRAAKGRGIPAVVLSGRASDDTAETVKQQGAAEFLPKPTSVAVIRSVIEQVASQRTPSEPERVKVKVRVPIELLRAAG